MTSSEITDFGEWVEVMCLMELVRLPDEKEEMFLLKQKPKRENSPKRESARQKGK